MKSDEDRCTSSQLWRQEVEHDNVDAALSRIAVIQSAGGIPNGLSAGCKVCEAAGFSAGSTNAGLRRPRKGSREPGLHGQGLQQAQQFNSCWAARRGLQQAQQFNSCWLHDEGLQQAQQFNSCWLHDEGCTAKAANRTTPHRVAGPRRAKPGTAGGPRSRGSDHRHLQRQAELDHAEEACLRPIVTRQGVSNFVEDLGEDVARADVHPCARTDQAELSNAG